MSVSRGFAVSGLLIMALPLLGGADWIWFAMPVTELLAAVYAARTIIKYTKSLPV